jgi:hypothetical protein
VPRAEGLRRHALVSGVGDGEVIDLRAVATALGGRHDIRDWRIITGVRGRDGGPRVVVRIVPSGGDTAGTVIGAAADIRTLAGTLPTQIVPSDPYEIQSLRGERHSERILSE